MLAVTAFASPAHADRSQAVSLFTEGRALATAGDYENACKKFSASFELDHSPGIELNLADCHEHLGHLRTAHQLFEDAAKRFEQRRVADRAGYAHKRALVLAERMGTIVITVDDPKVAGLVVRIDGRRVDAAHEIRELVEPGEITVTAEAPGRKLLEQHATVASGATASVELAEPGEPPPSIVVPITPPPPENHTRRNLVIGFGAGTVAAAAASLAFGFRALSRYDAAANDRMHCDPGDPPVCDSIGRERIAHAHDLAAVGTGFAIASSAFAITAIALYVSAPKSVVVAPSANGVAILGRF